MKTLDFTGRKIDTHRKKITLKPISKEPKLHNSIMINYEKMDKEKFNFNILKRYNLLENLYFVKSDKQKNFFGIMGSFNLYKHMNVLGKIDKKRRAIIYNDAISLICSFCREKKLDELLKETSLYKNEPIPYLRMNYHLKIKNKYTLEYSRTANVWMEESKFDVIPEHLESKTSYKKKLIRIKPLEKEKEEKHYIPLVGWVLKSKALSNNFPIPSAKKIKIKQGKIKFLKINEESDKDIIKSITFVPGIEPSPEGIMIVTGNQNVDSRSERRIP